MKKKTNESSPSLIQEKTAGWLAAFIIRVRDKWAKGMGRFTAKLSVTTLKVLLAAFTILMVVCSGLTILYSFTHVRKMLLNPDVITPPMVKMAAPKSHSFPLINDPAIMPVIKFRKCLDSLSLTESGKRTRDSLLLNRKGLMDSLKMVERLYGQ